MKLLVKTQAKYDENILLVSDTIKGFTKILMSYILYRSAELGQ